MPAPDGDPCGSVPDLDRLCNLTLDRVDARDGSAAVCDPDRAGRDGKSVRALADLDRVPLKRARIDPHHGVVARVRDPHRAVAEDERARPAPDGDALDAAPGRMCRARRPLRTGYRCWRSRAGRFATATAVGLEPATVTFSSRGAAGSTRAIVDSPNAAQTEPAPTATFACALARRPADLHRVCHLSELGIDLGEAAEQSVRDPQALALAVSDSGRCLIVERDEARVRALGRRRAASGFGPRLFPTQTDPAPKATGPGRLPTGTRSTTLFVAGSITPTLLASTSDPAPAPERLTITAATAAAITRPMIAAPIRISVRRERLGGHPRTREALGEPVGLELVERLGRVEVLQWVRAERATAERRPSSKPRAVPDMITWPPCAVAPMRAARATASPT